MLRRVAPFAIAAALLLTFAGCDNIARVWNRNPGSGGGGGGGGGQNAAEAITIPSANQIFRVTRPSVAVVEPTGGGLPITTPVVVLFDEAMNAASIREPQDRDNPQHLYVRQRGQETAIDGTYRFFANNRMVVFTPAQGFRNQTYEIVIGRDVVDLDQQRVLRSGVIGEFTTDGTSEAGLRVVAIAPENRERGVPTSFDPIIMLSGPVDESTVTADTLFLQDDSNAKITAPPEFPVSIGQARDTRFLRLNPAQSLDTGATYRLSVTNDIRAGEIRLDIGGRNPLVQFTTAEPSPPTAIAIANSAANFPNTVSPANIDNVEVDVTVPATARSGDTVRVRAYGFDATKTANERIFVEKTARVATDGAGTVKVTMAGDFGSAANPRFKEGSLTLLARVERGGDLTSSLLLSDVAFDVTGPSLTTLGPPGSSTSIVTDLGFAAVTGQASEEIGRLELTVGASMLELAGSDDEGRFWSQPVLLTRSTSTVPFVLTLYDRAGNQVPGPINGTFLQRGFLAGDVVTDTSLTVSVYDEATLSVVSGARVIVEPGLPQKPSAGREVATTPASGEVTFGSRTQASYSITVVADGYEMASVLGTSASYASIPLRPRTNATASLDAALTFVSGARARVGVNILDDEALDYSMPTPSSSVRSLEGMVVRPQRSLFASGFAGQFPPSVKPTYASGGTLIGGASSGRGRASAPPVSPEGAGTRRVSFLMPPASVNNVPAFTNVFAPYTLDFGLATGLDTANLVESPPRVSFLLGMSGLAGLCYVGPGIASGGPSNFSIDGSFSASAMLDFQNQGPVLWCSVLAQDASGNISRNRALFANIQTGLVTRLANPAGIPTITAPTGASTGSPSVTFADRLDAAAITSGLALRSVVVTGPAGRSWTVLSFDADAAGGSKSLQLPDLTGSGATGLATGTWRIRVEDRLIVSPGFGTGALVFEDMPRLEATWARAAPVNFTVN